MDYVRAFLVGGMICAIAQILMDKTKLTPARILVLYVTLGAILGGLGIYKKIITIGGAGATIPLMGFGNSLVQGTIKAVSKDGLTGVFTGGLTATAGGIAAAVFFGYIFSLIFNPRTKK
ncbi:stage V sporulation protein AE [Aceticella autotrophica]|uniref:Stage V sporulation protein AE n=1 Tax=Aceticella autotrophica TaxID=2755338 RepID=A0A974Y2S4_9THEO|nr:stage V sporulation protein AE [Aceticella autotrophica]QSZ26481.1 stage V sporulation protein AE [Aceticella autotrophica]